MGVMEKIIDSITMYVDVYFFKIAGLFFFFLIFSSMALLLPGKKDRERSKKNKGAEDKEEDKPSLSYFTRVHDINGVFYKDFKLELGYYLFNLFLTSLLVGGIVYVLTSYILPEIIPHQYFAGTVQNFPFWLQIFCGLIIADLSLFVPHWFAHHVFWRFHTIHHSAKEIHWLTGLRLHPVDTMVFTIGGVLVSYTIGFEGEAIVLATFVMTMYNFFVHANINLGYPKPLCYILVSPNYHRWHHARDKRAIDKNIATMFPVFDLIMGSYFYPHDEMPKEYGFFEPDKKAKIPEKFEQQLIYPWIYARARKENDKKKKLKKKEKGQEDGKNVR